MDNKEEIIEKIRKLFNKAESAEKIGSLQEAEIFAAKAQELLLKYALDKADLTKNAKPQFILRDVLLRDYVDKTDGKWFSVLFQVLAEYNLCDCYVHRYSLHKDKNKIVPIGEKDTIDIVEFLGYQLSARLVELQKISWRSYSGPTKKNAYKRAFLMGAVQAINIRLSYELKKKKEAEPQTNALVLHNSAALKEFVKEIAPDIKTKSSTSLSGDDAAIEGFIVGSRIDIRGGLKEGQKQEVLN